MSFCIMESVINAVAHEKKKASAFLFSEIRVKKWDSGIDSLALGELLRHTDGYQSPGVRSQFL